jgi:hypothetical protein
MLRGGGTRPHRTCGGSDGGNLGATVYGRIGHHRGPGGIPRGSFLDVALGVRAWLMLWGLPLGIVLLGVAVLRSGLFGRWKALPLAVGLLMSPLLNLLLFLPLYLVTGSDILVPTDWPDWPDFAFFVVPNAIVGKSWVLLGWVLLSGRGERLSSGVERASL